MCNGPDEGAVGGHQSCSAGKVETPRHVPGSTVLKGMSKFRGGVDTAEFGSAVVQICQAAAVDIHEEMRT